MKAFNGKQRYGRGGEILLGKKMECSVPRNTVEKGICIRDTSGSEVDRRGLLFHSWGIDAKREW